MTRSKEITTTKDFNFFGFLIKRMQVKINKVKQNLKQSKGCACEKLPSQKSSTFSPATAPEKELDC
jgi:hypothetical protein